MFAPAIVSLDDIRAAREVITGRLVRTPLLAVVFAGRADMPVWLKAENLQATGSFKSRGVLNKLRQLTAEQKQRGLITISAGNHAQALAYAASIEGLHALVVMPESASETKVAAARSYGAEVVLHGTTQQALDKMHELREARGLTLVHPYDDPFVIAGQGTVGLEIVEDLPDVDVVVVPVGGGGLISGIAAAVKRSRPSARVIGVEPEGAPTLTEALRTGRPVRLERIATIADGLTAPVAGEHTLAHVRALVDEVVLITDEEIAAGLRAVVRHAKLVAEPAGAAGVAALLAGLVTVPPGARTAVVVSGGNVDLGRLQEVLGATSL